MQKTCKGENQPENCRNGKNGQEGYKSTYKLDFLNASGE